MKLKSTKAFIALALRRGEQQKQQQKQDQQNERLMIALPIPLGMGTLVLEPDFNEAMTAPTSIIMVIIISCAVVKHMTLI